MGKKKKNKGHEETKRDRERVHAEAAQAREALERRRRRLRIANLAVPLVTIVAAGVTYFLSDSKGPAALVGLIGVAIWMPVLLGGLGATVPPRDRNRAGSIDFGQRR
jgi:Na+/citrate or Na+/malate symporter